MSFTRHRRPWGADCVTTTNTTLATAAAYRPRISSPLAARRPVSYSAPPPSSSPPLDSSMTLTDLPEHDPTRDDDGMQMDDCCPLPQHDCPRDQPPEPAQGHWDPSGTSSLLATTTPAQRAAGFKQPAFPSARQSLEPTHQSSTALLKTRSKPRLSPAQLRQQAANQLRAHQRNEMLSSRRMLLNAIDDLLAVEEDSMNGLTEHPTQDHVDQIYEAHQLHQADVPMFR